VKKLCLFLLFILFGSLGAYPLQGVSLGAITAGDPGDEYIMLSRTGVLSILSQSKIQPTALQGTTESPVAIFQATLLPQERVASQPYFYRALTDGYSYTLFVTTYLGDSRVWSVKCDVNLNCTGSFANAGLIETFFASDSGLYVIHATGLRLYRPGAGSAEELPLSFGSFIPRLATVGSTGDSVLLATVDGYLSWLVSTNGVWSFDGFRGGLPAGKKMQRAAYVKGSNIYALLDDGSIYKADSDSRVWQMAVGASASRTDGDVAQVVAGSLYLLTSAGDVQEINLSSGAVLERTAVSISSQAAVIRDLYGRPLGGSDVRFSTGPFGFYDVSPIQYYERGRFHHQPSLEITGFQSYPAYFSWNKFTAVDMRYAIAGSPTTDSSFLMLALDTSLGFAAAGETIRSRAPISSGIVYDAFSPGNKSDGRYWLMLVAFNGQDTVHKYLSLLMDNSPPVGEPVASLDHPLPGNNIDVIVGGTHVVVSPRQRLHLDFSSMHDADPFATAGAFDIHVEMKDSATGITYDWTFTKTGADTLSWNFDGLSRGGVALPDGSYTFSIYAQDSASNTGTTWTGLPLGINSITHIIINRQSALVQGRVRPLVVTQSVQYQPLLDLSLQGMPDRRFKLSLKLDDGSYLVSSKTAKRWQDTSIVLDKNGEWNLKTAFLVDSTQDGGHYVAVQLENEYGFVQEARLAYVVDHFQTTIVYPENGNTMVGETAIRGIATAPLMDSLEFAKYKVYYLLDTLLEVPANLTSEQALLALHKNWKPARVPSANQSAADPTYPKSHIGVVDNTVNGVLGYFIPPAGIKNGQKVTLLVYSLSKKAEDGSIHISYDSKRVYYQAPASVDSVTLQLQASPGDSLVLSDASVENDSLHYTFLTQGVAASIDVTITGDNGAVLHEVLYCDGTTPVGLWFNGRDFTNRYVVSGTYKIHAEAWLENRQKLVQAARSLYVSIPVAADTSSLLTVGPIPVLFNPGSGIQPTVTFDVTLDQPAVYYLDVLTRDKGTIRVVDTVQARGASYVWDFSNSSGNHEFLLNDMATQETMAFTARLTILENGKQLRQVSKDFSVVSGGRIVAITDPLFEKGQDGDSLEYAMQSAFKFRGILHGELNYYPDRALAYAPVIKGQQVLKRHLKVPYLLDYRKYYRDVDIITDAEYLTKYKMDCFLSSDKERSGEVGVVDQEIRKVPGEIRFQQYANGSEYVRAAYSAMDTTWFTGKKQYTYVLPKRDFASYYQCESKVNGTCAGMAASQSIDFTQEDWNCDEVWRQGKVVGGSIRSSFFRGKGEADPYGRLWYLLPISGQDGNTPTYVVSDLDTSRSNTSVQEHILWAGENIIAFTDKANMQYDLEDPYNFEEDKKQRLYIVPPKFDYNHHYLSPTSRVGIPSMDFLSGSPFNDFFKPDEIPWEAQSQTGTDCKKDTITLADGRDTVYTHCDANRGGKKVGDVGFGYRPNFSAFQEVDGKRYYAHDYIANFFHKDTVADCHVCMDSLSHDLTFKPRLDTSRAMFRVTWDTVFVEYPFVNASRYGERLDRIGDSIIAFTTHDGVDHFEFIKDTTQYLKLVVQDFPKAGIHYLDSADLEFSNYTSALLPLLNRGANPDSLKLFGYVEPGSIDYSSTRLQSYFRNLAGKLQDEGELGSASNPDDNMYYTVVTRGTGLNSSMRVYYLNRPVSLGSWSSAQDSMFDKTKGYLYGMASLNAGGVGFRSQDEAMDNKGFLGLVSSKGLNIPKAKPSLAAPFVLDTAANSTSIVFNPLLTSNSLKWDLEVYYYDGYQVNTALDSVAGSADNFTVRLNLETTPKNFIPIPGRIPASIRVDNRSYVFKDYAVFHLEDLDSNGVRKQVYLPVNRFYRCDSCALNYGTVLPDIALDFWSKDSLPILAYWDVTHRNGFFPVYIQARYTNNGEIVTVQQSRVMKVGTVASDAGEAFEVSSPYNRASILFESPLAQAGDQVSIYPVAFADLDLPFEAPEVVPVGPVLEVLTTGSHNFTGADKKPVVTYRYSAREIYTLNGLTDFDSDISAKTVAETVEQLKGQYRIYMLGEDGSLDAQVTVAMVQYSDEKEDVYLELKAAVDHFSWVLVLSDTTSKGGLPVIKTVYAKDDSIYVKGLYGSESILQNLLLKVSSANHLSDSSAVRLTKNITVAEDGSFLVSFPQSILVGGDNWIYVKYDYSANAAKASYYLEPGQLALTGWSDGPDPFVPTCATSIHQVTANANKNSSVVRTVRNADFQVLSSEQIDFERGAVSFGWDGCLDGLPLSAGLYYHEFRTLAGDSLLQVVEATVGSVPSMEVLAVSVDQNPFQPSAEASFHVLGVTVKTLGLTDGDLIVKVMHDGNEVAVLTPVSQNAAVSPQIWTAQWNGLSNGLAVPAGSYRIVAYRNGSLATPRSVAFEVVARTAPLVTMRQDPASLSFPVLNGLIKVSSDSVLDYKLWLEDALGKVYARLQGDVQTWGVLGKNQVQGAPFQVTNAAQVPVRAVMAWQTDGGMAGMDTLLLDWEKVGLGIKVQSATKDTLFVGVSTADLKYFNASYTTGAGQASAGSDYVAEWNVRFESDRAGQVRFALTGASGKSEWLIDVTSGLNSWTWDGRMDGAFVEEGSYTLSMQACSPLDNQTCTDVQSWNVPVKRLPKLVVSVLDGSLSDPTMGLATTQAFANALREDLQELGLRRIMVLGPDATRAYMQVSEVGAVAFVNAEIDPRIHSGSTYGLVQQYVQKGGKVGFFNTLPLQSWGSGTDGLAASLTLYGYDALKQYQSFDSLKAEVFSAGIAMDSLDAGIASQLIWPFNTAGELKSYVGSSVDMQALSSTGLRYAGIGYNKKNPGLTIGQFVKPRWKSLDSRKTGSFLSLYPGRQSIGATDVAKMAKDYATVLNSYFFSSDLFLGEESVAFAPADAKLDSLRRGDKMKVDIQVGFMGDRTLETVKVRLADETNKWSDTVELKNVSFGKDNSLSTLVPIGDDWAFDTNTIVVEVLPFKVDTLINGQTVTITEFNKANNKTHFHYVIEDTVAPVIEIKSKLDAQAATEAVMLEQAYSGRTGTWILELAGETSTRHHMGKVDLQLEWIDALGNKVLAKAEQKASDSATPFLFKLSPAAGLLTHGHVDTLRLRATDKYGNSQQMPVLVRVDQKNPVIDSVSIANALTGVLDSMALPDISYQYTMAAGTPKLYLKVNDNVQQPESGLKAYKLFAPNGSAMFNDSSWAGAMTKELPGLAMPEAENGRYTMIIADRAGNKDTATFELSMDTEEPVIRVYDTKQTLFDLVNAGRFAHDTLSVYWLRDRPLYAFASTITEIEDGVSIIRDNTHGEPLPDAATRVAQGTKVQEVEYNPGVVDQVALTIDVMDASSLTFTVSVDGVALKDGELNPYVNGASGTIQLADSLKPAVHRHLFGRYLVLPMTKARREVVIQATDAARNVSTLTLLVGAPASDLQAVDAKGDQQVAGSADLGEFYFTQQAAGSDSVDLYAMVHSYNGGRIGMERNHVFYFDSDNDSTTGSGALATWSDQFQGFDYRLEIKKLDSLDGNAGHVGVWSHFESGSWGTLAGLDLAANQFDRIWTSSVGAGHQVTPTNRVARAPGGLFEFRVRMPGLFSADRPMRWFVSGDDPVYDTVEVKPYAFDGSSVGVRVVDGAAADWYLERAPDQLSQLRYRASVQEAAGALAFTLENGGLGQVDSLRLRYFVNNAACQNVRALDDGGQSAYWSLAQGLFRPARDLPGLSAAPASLHYLELNLTGRRLTPGSILRDLPRVRVLDNACSVSGGEVQLWGDGVLLDGHTLPWTLNP
jgi:hypothetical protein